MAVFDPAATNDVATKLQWFLFFGKFTEATNELASVINKKDYILFTKNIPAKEIKGRVYPAYNTDNCVVITESFIRYCQDEITQESANKAAADANIHMEKAKKIKAKSKKHKALAQQAIVEAVIESREAQNEIDSHIKKLHEAEEMLALLRSYV